MLSWYWFLSATVLTAPLSLLQATESELGDVDLSGLPEAAVDSEEEEEEDEDLERASDTLLGRDLVRECLEKDPADRNDDDIGKYNAVLLFRMCSTEILPLGSPGGYFGCCCSWALKGNIYHSASTHRGDTQIHSSYRPFANTSALPMCIFK